MTGTTVLRRGILWDRSQPADLFLDFLGVLADREAFVGTVREVQLWEYWMASVILILRPQSSHAEQLPISIHW
jgi:hypothetical protein